MREARAKRTRGPEATRTPAADATAEAAAPADPAADALADPAAEPAAGVAATAGRGDGDRWGVAARPGGAARRSAGDGDRVRPGMADVLMHRLFAVGLDLHAALTYIEANIGRSIAVQKIHKAIGGLDMAIREFRGVIFDLYPGDTPPPAGSRTLIVEAVERACGPGGACPAITLGNGLDNVLDLPTSYHLARVIHRILTLMPGDHLPNAHVEVMADGRPPERLVVHIDAPARDLAEVAGRVRGLDGRRIDVSCHDLARSPGRSRIRLECPPAGG